MSVIYKFSSFMVAASKYIQHRNTDKLVNSILEIADFSTIKNQKVSQFKTVLFVTPFMSQHSGGLTSVLRIAQRLEERGLAISFVCPTSNACEIMESNAKSNLETFDANYITWEQALNSKYDFVIAVQDTIVYYARKIRGYLIYFVQDYEPYFFPVGDRHYLSRKAYELGEDIISLGNWNIQEIRKNIPVNNVGNMYSVEFPFEAKEYPISNKNLSQIKLKNEISIAVYVKREAKRLPGIVLNMLESVHGKMAENGIKFNIYYFGLHKIEKPKIGINLGRISKSEIRELYEKCDFGMVASMTNISLVPYEMISSGLPVIEFKDGSYPTFLGTDSAILLNTFNYLELFDKIMYYKSNPDELTQITVNASNRIKTLSWDRTGEQFFNILKSIFEEE